ncbi:LOW QUALITY PROTEIN: diaminohydroxyphosphoribosylaminopyrimidine deaminase [Bacillus sp. JCM 19045]|nr:LOW QUALITY PROTEIN: diaminohydroxyphosphoribosylaminopyrimidine deaminase [Bacillus sp. JCM 19045]
MHETYMKLALENARTMRGQTDPNPTVGCVLVKEGRVIGIGAHLKAGGPHAEIHALQMAGKEAVGCTAYVTLEPCSHTGKTGPCALALIEAGVKQVVVAMLDPNPLVAGNGIRCLKKQGIHVETGVCEYEARALNDVFIHSILHQKPFVTAKTAITLDGKLSTHTGSSQWITSSEARTDVHHLRSEHQAIMVGVGTVVQDNPALTARIPNGRNPLRIIVDSHLRTPLNAQVITDGQAPTWIFTAQATDENKRKALQDLGVEVIKTSGTEQVNLEEMLHSIYQRSITSILLEAGGTLNASFIEAELISKLILYMAPKIIGGRLAPTFLEGEGIGLMNDAIPVEIASVDFVGKDLKITAYPQYSKKPRT